MICKIFILTLSMKNSFVLKQFLRYGINGYAMRPPLPADKCTKLSWYKGDICMKDNLRA